MRKFIIAALFLSSLKTTAQTTGKDSLLTKLAGIICEEASKKDLANISPAEAETELSLAFLPAFEKYPAEIAKYYDLNDEDGPKKLGMDIGLKMATACPAVFKIMMKMDEEDSKKTPLTAAPLQAQGTKGTLIKIVEGDFTYFLIKTSEGKTEKIWWMEYFPGADKINRASLNKILIVGYTEKEVYNAALKEYVKIKVAVSVN